MELTTKYGDVKIFTDNIDELCIGQIIEMANSPLGENANIRMMPDVHLGSGCCIGTTMIITDKVCPNLVGVDIGCAVTLAHTNIDWSKDFSRLDEIIRKYIPNGMVVHQKQKEFDFKKLKCYNKLSDRTKELASRSLGTLGGGNHFIECYNNGYISIHSGSRNIGWRVAEYYQNLAEHTLREYKINNRKEILKNVNNEDKEKFLKENRIAFKKELSYLTGDNMNDYLHDVIIMQDFASKNRIAMINAIVSKYDDAIIDNVIDSIHNYIDVETKILRKGAISAKKDEMLVIPMNMRDGLLLCKGKGNQDWNYSAPHGAGRLYSRSKAKKELMIEEYKQEMQGIYSTCINESTLDESPMAYKPFEEIMQHIEPTVEILERLIPLYNFKAN